MSLLLLPPTATWLLVLLLLLPVEVEAPALCQERTGWAPSTGWDPVLLLALVLLLLHLLLVYLLLLHWLECLLFWMQLIWVCKPELLICASALFEIPTNSCFFLKLSMTLLYVFVMFSLCIENVSTFYTFKLVLSVIINNVVSPILFRVKCFRALWAHEVDYFILLFFCFAFSGCPIGRFWTFMCSLFM